jgi:hypothetical protein
MSAPTDYSRLEWDELVDQFGGVQDVFRPHRGDTITSMVFGVGLLVLGSIIEAYFALVRRVFDEPSLAIMGLCLIFFWSGTAALVRSIRRRDQQVVICVDGLIKKASGTTVAARWLEIAQVIELENRSSMLGRRSLGYSVVLKADAGAIALELDCVAELERLVKRIEYEVSRPAEARGGTQPAPEGKAELLLGLDEIAVELGGFVEEFRPKRATIWIGLLLGALMTTTGAILLIVFVPLLPLVGGKALGYGLVGLAVLFCVGVERLITSIRLSSYRVVVCTDGLVEARRRPIRVWRWQDVTRVDERSGAYVIHAKTGHELKLSTKTIEGLDRLGAMIEQAAAKRSIPWQKA